MSQVTLRTQDMYPGIVKIITKPDFRFSRFSFFSARFFFSVFLCGNIPQKTKILGPNCGIKKRNQGNKRKPGEKNSDSWFSYEFNNKDLRKVRGGGRRV